MDHNQQTYQSYKDFIEAILPYWPEYIGLFCSLRDDTRLRSIEFRRPGVYLVIADCFDASVETKVFYENDQIAEPEVMKEALNSYNEGVKVRVIMVTPCRRVPAEMIDALGMTLNIDPAFFQFSIERARHRMLNCPYHPITGQPEFERLGRYLFFEPYLYAHFLSVQIDATTTVPIVLCLTTDEFWCRPDHGIWGFERPNICKPAPSLSAVSTPCSPHGLYEFNARLNIFREMLRSVNENGVGGTSDLCMEYLRPLIRIAIQNASSRFNQLKEWRTLSLRHYIGAEPGVEDFIAENNKCLQILDGLRSLVRALIVHYPRAAQIQSRNFSHLKEQCENIIDDGQRQCRLVQDLIHAKTASSSIEASRKSIEEAVSVKHLAQLALVFIPLTYASSLFGMNIKEMSGDGPRLWTFILVSLIISITTLGFANLVKYATRWMNIHLREPAYAYHYFLLYGVVGLRIGLFGWMIRQGLLIPILSGGHFGTSINPLGELLKKIEEKLRLSPGEKIWPPPRGYNMFYFKKRGSRQSSRHSSAS